MGVDDLDSTFGYSIMVAPETIGEATGNRGIARTFPELLFLTRISTEKIELPKKFSENHLSSKSPIPFVQGSWGLMMQENFNWIHFMGLMALRSMLVVWILEFKLFE